MQGEYEKSKTYFSYVKYKAITYKDSSVRMSLNVYFMNAVNIYIYDSKYYARTHSEHKIDLLTLESYSIKIGLL